MSRFAAVLSILVLASAVTDAFAADRWIAPTAVGKKDGSGPADAAGIGAIDGQIRAAGPGGRVFLIADRGPFMDTGNIDVKSGGTPDRPVTVTGATSTGAPAVATIDGIGLQIFRLYTTASHLTFRNIAFRDAGQGCFVVVEPITGITISDVDATGVRKLFDMRDGTSMTGFTFRNLTSSKFSKSFIQLKNASDGLISDLWLDSAWADGDAFPFGVHADGVTHDVTIRNMTVKRIVYSYQGDPNRYWNGDGIATEEQTYGITMDNISVDGVSDAGFDLKGGTADRPHLISNVTVNNAKRGLRVWGNVVADNIRIGNLRFPSAVVNGKTVTQSSGSGPLASVWMKEGSTLRFRNVTRDGVTIGATAFDRWDGPSNAIAW
jgi:hypothetical protein